MTWTIEMSNEELLLKCVVEGVFEKSGIQNSQWKIFIDHNDH